MCLVSLMILGEDSGDDGGGWGRMGEEELWGRMREDGEEEWWGRMGEEFVSRADQLNQHFE